MEYVIDEEWWESLFVFENVSITTEYTTSYAEPDVEIIKIDGKKWERSFYNTYNFDWTYYEKYTVIYDGENKYVNGELDNDCTITKEAFFVYILPFANSKLFYEDNFGCYKYKDEIFTIFGLNFSDIEINIGDSLIKSIQMTLVDGAGMRIEYNFFDYGTTIVGEIADNEC